MFHVKTSQTHAPMTEAEVDEVTASLAEASLSEHRAFLQSPTLLSDMQSFKAANGTEAVIVGLNQKVPCDV